MVGLSKKKNQSTYGSAICMAKRIVDPYVVDFFFLHSSPFSMMKIDKNSSYTPHKHTYTIRDQICFQIVLNGSNLH